MSRAIKSLPRGGSWEIGLVDLPGVKVQGEAAPSVVLVVDTDDGSVRQIGFLESPDDLPRIVSDAALRPATSLRPARPGTIRCLPALRRRLQPLAKQLGARLRVCSELPELDLAARSLIDSFKGPPLLLPSEPEAWRPVVQRLGMLLPWQVLPDSVLFRFPGGPDLLADACACVLGRAGTQIGVSVFPTQRDYQLFLDVVDGGLQAVAEPWRVVALHLDSLLDLSQAQRDLCFQHGLVTQGMGMLLLGIGPEGMGSPLPDEEAMCLAAVQGILGAFVEHGRVMTVRPTRCLVATNAGLANVVTEPEVPAQWYEGASLIVDRPHQFYASDQGLPFMALKYAKADAKRAASILALSGVDHLSLEPFRDRTEVIAWSGGCRIGVLTRAPVPPQVRSHWEAVRVGRLIISAGGAKRPGLRPSDYLATFDVALRD